MLDQQNQRWYVSYAWADEDDPTREEKVDRFCEDASRRGVEIIRDKTTLSRGDRISEFMEKIGEGHRVFIFLSHKYLRSPYCMFELFEVWRNNRQDSAEFLHHVRVFTVDGAKIGKADEWLNYTQYWQTERDKLQQTIDRVGWMDAGEATIKAYKNMQKFASQVSDVIALFADVVRPRTFEEFLKYGFDDPPKEDEAILKVKTAIENVFTMREFDQLITLTFSASLYKLYVPKPLKAGFNTLTLLHELQARRIVTQFLRAVLRARPDALKYPLIYVTPNAPVKVAFWRRSSPYRSTSGRRRASGMLAMRS